MTAQTNPGNPDPEAGEPVIDEASLPEAEIIEEPPVEVLEKKLTPQELLQKERDEFYENWRRTQADFQNHRRRQSQLMDMAVKGARRELFSEMLLVLDYLDMALLSPVETQEGKNLLMGVQMTRNQMMQLLESHEIETIESQGAFNPEQHEAIEMIEDSDQAPGTIVQTVRRGYTIGTDVLRHAHVKVAAEPKPTTDDEAAPNSTER
jgi:molecular chaperone GrpE